MHRDEKRISMREGTVGRNWRLLRAYMTSVGRGNEVLCIGHIWPSARDSEGSLFQVEGCAAHTPKHTMINCLKKADS